MASILVIANPSDEATRIGYYFMEQFAKYAAKKGHRVIFQKTPTLQALYKALIDYDPDLVVANGHGGFKSLTVGPNILIGIQGYDAATKRKINNGDPEYFQDRIVLLLTCNAGRELVNALVNAGAKAAMGFQEPFIFMSDDSLTPDQDKAAKPFFVSMLQPALQLADGATFKEAINFTRETFKQYIKQDLDPTSQKYLRFNLENLVALGDPDAKLT
jgi:hypothetical protein